ncbi:MAG: hypothetical protein PHC85_02510 [Candidatus Pacebacteria bacterium]|nr:hypothetical protein [Candidatus Paceibacterota bacterium]
MGTFLFGLPGESKESCEKTIEFAKEIGADFASFNILIPRMNTNIRKQAIEKGWVKSGIKVMDQSGNFSVMGSDKMTAEEILGLKEKADKSFYLRPSYLLRRIASIRNTYELKLLVINGFSVINQIFKRKDD